MAGHEIESEVWFCVDMKPIPNEPDFGGLRQ